MQHVRRRCYESANAPGLTPHTLVASAFLSVVVVARIEFAVIDPQLASKQVQLLASRVAVGRIFRARRQLPGRPPGESAAPCTGAKGGEFVSRRQSVWINEQPKDYPAPSLPTLEFQLRTVGPTDRHQSHPAPEFHEGGNIESPAEIPWLDLQICQK